MARGGRLANPAEIEKYLHGIDYPASKDDLIDKAQENDAPDEVIETLDRLNDQMFNSPIDVSKNIGQFM